ncbi:MAG TPA: hypothetical protein V6D14_33995 [Coleofasciculaceae cyanobacterium]|jgi:hypothetical protein
MNQPYSQLGATKYETFGRGFKSLLPIGCQNAEGIKTSPRPSAFLGEFHQQVNALIEQQHIASHQSTGLSKKLLEKV